MIIYYLYPASISDEDSPMFLPVPHYFIKTVPITIVLTVLLQFYARQRSNGFRRFPMPNTHKNKGATLFAKNRERRVGPAQRGFGVRGLVTSSAQASTRSPSKRKKVERVGLAFFRVLGFETSWVQARILNMFNL
jgi:hypothetical protein